MVVFNKSFFIENPFINRGIGGQTTPQMLIRFKPDVVNLNPKAVVILAESMISQEILAQLLLKILLKIFFHGRNSVS